MAAWASFTCVGVVVRVEDTTHMIFSPHAQGDIGTSLLYVYSTIFANIDLPNQPNPEEIKRDIYGAISLIFWTLTLVALIKYVLVVLRANDTGEGEHG